MFSPLDGVFHFSQLGSFSNPVHLHPRSRILRLYTRIDGGVVEGVLGITSTRLKQIVSDEIAGTNLFLPTYAENLLPFGVYI